MKKLPLITFALLLIACNTFQVSLQVNPTPTYPASLTSSLRISARTPAASPTGMPEVSLTPSLLSGTTATPVHAVTRTLTEAPLVVSPAPRPTYLSALPAGRSLTLTGLQMQDAAQGWAMETEGHAVHTSDGGRTWKDVITIQAATPPSIFFALDAQTAWTGAIARYGSLTWRTIDEGRDWYYSDTIKLEAVDPGSCSPLKLDVMTRLEQLFFIDAYTGWLVGVADANGHTDSAWLLFSTSDGGFHWKLRNISTRTCSTGGMPDGLRSVFFRNPMNGWAGFSTTRWSYFPDPNGDPYVGGWDVYRTKDGGQTWQRNVLPDPPGLLNLLARPENAQSEAACGVNQILSLSSTALGLRLDCSIYLARTIQQNYFYISPDDGLTWRAVAATGNEDFVNPDLGWRLYTDPDTKAHRLQRTDNGGRTWMTIKTVAWEKAQFDFIDGKSGWAIVVGNDSVAFVRTTNGGMTWSEIKPVVAKP